ncbi:hypothetical protein FOA52_012350 [Chlamydomonas sp. UWO 241]|nr:hypothetical protein FOA52_012350 [Chlamydomonas sp. UWO 241]
MTGHSFGSGPSKWIIQPDARWWMLWCYVTVASAMITGFVEPFKIAFTQAAGEFPGTSFWSVQDYIAMAIFMADLAMRFFVADVANADTGELATDLKTIRLSYFHGMFWYDFMFVFPFDWIALLIVKSTAAGQADPHLEIYVSCIKFIKLGRMYRVLEFFTSLDKKMIISDIAVLLIRNWLYVLYSSHWAACIFYLIARLEYFGENSWVGRAADPHRGSGDRLDGTSIFGRYIYSLYIAIAAFVGSVGDNDFYEASVPEAMFMIFYCLMNVVLSSYILGTVTMLMVKFDERSKQLRDQKTNLIKFKGMHQIPDSLFNAMSEHLELHFHSEQTADESVLAIYPSNLRRKVLRNLYSVQLKACYLLSDVGFKFIDALLAASRVELFMPNVDLLQHGDMAQELYIIMDGDVLVASKADAGGRMGSMSRANSTSHAYSMRNSGRMSFNSRGGSMEGDDEQEKPGLIGMLKSKVAALKGSLRRMTSRASPESAVYDDGDTSMRGSAYEKDRASLSGSRSLRRLLTTLEGSATVQKRSCSATFGELSFFTEMPSQEVAVSLSVTRILQVSRTAFLGLGALFPADMRSVMLKVLNGAESTLSNELCDMSTDERLGVINEALGNPDRSLALPPHELELLLGSLTPSQVLLYAALCTLKNAVKTYFELADSSRVIKLLNNAANNNVQEVQSLLIQGGISPDIAGHDARTALHIAASQGHVATVQALLDHGANPMLADHFARTPLLEAAQNGHDLVVNLLREYKASLRGDNFSAGIELCSAVAENDLPYLKRLLDADAEPDSTFTDGRTPLHLAAADGNLEMVATLLEAGATVDLTDRWGRTALDDAQKAGHADVIAHLIPKMAEAVTQRETRTDLVQLDSWMAAAALGQMDKIGDMLKAGVDVDATSRAYGGRTALMLAAEAGHEALIVRLLEGGASAATCDVSGFTALFYAARVGNLNLVSSLVERGMGLHMEQQLVTYQLCCSAASTSGVQLLRALLRAGANPNHGLLSTGTTPLHSAAVANCVPCLRQLLLEGADPKATSAAGRTPLQDAERVGARMAATKLREAMGASQDDGPPSSTAPRPHAQVQQGMGNGNGPLIKAGHPPLATTTKMRRMSSVAACVWDQEGDEDPDAAVRAARRRRSAWFAAHGSAAEVELNTARSSASGSIMQSAAGAAAGGRRASTIVRSSGGAAARSSGARGSTGLPGSLLGMLAAGEMSMLVSVPELRSSNTPAPGHGSPRRGGAGGAQQQQQQQQPGAPTAGRKMRRRSALHPDLMEPSRLAAAETDAKGTLEGPHTYKYGASCGKLLADTPRVAAAVGRAG